MNRYYGASAPDDHYFARPPGEPSLPIYLEDHDITSPPSDPLALRLLLLGYEREAERIEACRNQIVNPQTLDEYLLKGRACNQRFCEQCRRRYNRYARTKIRDILFDHRKQGDHFSLLTLKAVEPSIVGGIDEFMGRYERIRRTKALCSFSAGIGAIETELMPYTDPRVNIHVHLVVFSSNPVLHADFGKSIRERWVVDPADSVDLRIMGRRDIDLKRVSNYVLKSPWVGHGGNPPGWESLSDEQLRDAIDGLRGKRLVLRWGSK